MNLRTARPDDAPRLAALLSAVWVGTYATEGVTPGIAAYVLAEFRPERVAEELQSSGRHAWVVEDGAGLVGYADLQLDQATVHLGSLRQAEVLRVYVHPAHARRGIGSRLLRTCAAFAFARGCAAIWLSVWEKNGSAMRFYEAEGWEDCGTTTFRLGDTDHPNRVYALRNAPPR